MAAQEGKLMCLTFLADKVDVNIQTKKGATPGKCVFESKNEGFYEHITLHTTVIRNVLLCFTKEMQI